MQDKYGFPWVTSSFWIFQGFPWNQNNEPRWDYWTENKFFLQCPVHSLPEQQETGPAIPSSQFHHHINCSSNKMFVK